MRRVFSFISFLALKVRPGVTAQVLKWTEVIASKATCWIRWRRVLRQFCAKALLPKTHDQSEASLNSMFEQHYFSGANCNAP